MKRVILLLSTVLLGVTGCTSRSRAGDVTFFWSFADAFGRTSGNPGDNNGCGVAAVDEVDITIDGATHTFTCTGPNAAGITLQTFLPGTYDFTATGFRGNEAVFTTTGTVDVFGGRDNQFDVALQATSPQGFVVFFNVNGVAQCTGFAGIVYRLVNAAGQIVATTESIPGNAASPQNAILCDPVSVGFTIPNLPVGTYRFDYLTGIDAQQRAVVQTCLATVAHGGFPVILNLTTQAAQASCL